MSLPLKYRWHTGQTLTAPATGDMKIHQTYIQDSGHISFDNVDLDQNAEEIWEIVRAGNMPIDAILYMYSATNPTTKWASGTLKNLTHDGFGWWKGEWACINRYSGFGGWSEDETVIVEVTFGWQTSVATPSTGVTLWNTNGFRLTLESNVPDDVEDRSAKSTIYWTPYTHDAIALYDGTKWNIRNTTQKSLALSGLTADKNYDVFVYDNAGTPTLELGSAWTNDTTRATEIERLNGVWVKDGAPTRRYVGSFRSTSTTTTESTHANRFLYNFDNPLPTQMYGVGNSSHTWPYSTVRVWGGSDAYGTSKVLIGVGNQRILEGTAGSYGYSGSFGDARILVCVSDDVLDFPLEAESTLVQSGVPTWTWVEASRKRLPQGVNYVRLCQRWFSGTHNYSWYVRNFTVQL